MNFSRSPKVLWAPIALVLLLIRWKAPLFHMNTIKESFLLLTDHTCGYCSLLPNLLKGFGWNPGKRMLRWFGEQLKERTGDGDITFKEVSQEMNSPYMCPSFLVTTSWECLMMQKPWCQTLMSTSLGVGGWYSLKFYKERLRPKVSPFTLSILLWQKRYPFRTCIPLTEKRYPFDIL